MGSPEENQNPSNQNRKQNQGRIYRGRQKINIAKIEKETNLLVTFSKRKAGVFKKVSELCTLCGVEAFVIIFSPGNKIYSFGHPSFEATVDRFLKRNNLPISIRNQLIQVQQRANMSELNLFLKQAESNLEAQKKWAEDLKKSRIHGQSQNWYPSISTDQLSTSELKQMKAALLGLKEKLDAEVQNGLYATELNPYLHQAKAYPDSSGGGFSFSSGTPTLAGPSFNVQHDPRTVQSSSFSGTNVSNRNIPSALTGSNFSPYFGGVNNSNAPTSFAVGDSSSYPPSPFAGFAGNSNTSSSFPGDASSSNAPFLYGHSVASNSSLGFSYNHMAGSSILNPSYKLLGGISDTTPHYDQMAGNSTMVPHTREAECSLIGPLYVTSDMGSNSGFNNSNGFGNMFGHGYF